MRHLVYQGGWVTEPPVERVVEMGEHPWIAKPAWWYARPWMWRALIVVAGLSGLLVMADH